MPEVEHTVTVRARRDAVWDFVKDINNWAPYLVGYQKHEILNDTDSVWTVEGRARMVQVQVHITEWNGPEEVAFTVKGLTEPLFGSGAFLAAHNPDGPGSQLTFKMSLTGGGMTRPMVDAIIAPLLKPVAKVLAKRIVARVEELQTAAGA